MSMEGVSLSLPSTCDTSFSTPASLCLSLPVCLWFFHLLFFVDHSPLFVLAYTSLCLFIFTLLLYFCFTFVSIFFACHFPPPFHWMLNFLFSYFNDNFQVPCLIIPFCEEVTVGSKGNTFTFLKLRITIPMAKQFCLASLFKKVANRGSRKEMLMANSENL